MILEKVRNQHVYVTLLGPRNETLTGQLNMTDFQSLSRTDPRDVVEPKDPSGGSTPKFYDSRGAAYYICVFILVYALAIVMFVASLARRRRSSYQNGEFSRLPKCDILHYYNAESVSSARETTTAAELYSFAKDDEDDTAAPRHSTTTALRFQRPSRANRILDSTRGIEIGLGKVEGCSHPDELITLVQVLPCTDVDTNPEAYWADGSGSDDTHRHTASSHEQKCRWSIGPDGNLFILQVDEDDSSTTFCLEDNNDKSLVKNIGTCKQDLNTVGDKSENDCLPSNTRINDRNGVSANYADCYKKTPASDSRRNIVPCTEKSNTDISSIEPTEEITVCIKCDSMSLAEQDCIITDNNYNCDFENPWGLPTYPEIQKLVHVTSV